MNWLIAWLVLILPSSVMGNITPNQLELIDYAYIQTVRTGIDAEKFVNLIQCESNFEKDAVGDNGNANGILQFWQPTFYRFSKEYKIWGEYKDPKTQVEIASRMIKDGQWRHWENCGKKVGYGFCDETLWCDFGK